MTQPSVRIAIDIGGSFTDFVLMDDQGRVAMEKVPTTPQNPERGVLEGLDQLLEWSGIDPAVVDDIVHGTTLATNALIERNGAKVAMITTRGFRDVLEIGREQKFDTYDIFITRPTPLVRRSMIVEIDERVGPTGEIETALTDDEVDRALRACVELGAEVVVVCLLHSYIRPDHERKIVEYARGTWPELVVVASSSVMPAIREYERFSTAVVNGYVRPKVEGYLLKLLDEIRAREISGSFSVMLSNGGITDALTAAEFPVRIVESGPTAGVIAANVRGRQAGESNILAFDMGGTTAKSCLSPNGQPRMINTFEVDRVHRFKKGSGIPIQIPAVELIEIGAGGGSIARVNDLGLLKVGPQSAVADPGPACYGRGGEEPTVTDADLLLGYLNPSAFLGGAMSLDVEAAEKAVRKIADALGVSIQEAAWGIHEVVNENMANSTLRYAAELGFDVRDFTLVASGGAGPVHAFDLARRLGVRRVIVPQGAGVGSAFGFLAAPARFDVVRGDHRVLTRVEGHHVRAIYEEMISEASTVLSNTGVPAAQQTYVGHAAMRYVGQSYEVDVPLDVPTLLRGEAQLLRTWFDQAYASQYGRLNDGVEVEVLGWHLTALGPNREMPGLTEFDKHPSCLGEIHRPAYFPDWGDCRDVPIHQRAKLAIDQTIDGPAIIEEGFSTIVVGPNARARIDWAGNAVIDLGL